MGPEIAPFLDAQSDRFAVGGALGRAVRLSLALSLLLPIGCRALRRVVAR